MNSVFGGRCAVGAKSMFVGVFGEDVVVEELCLFFGWWFASGAVCRSHFGAVVFFEVRGMVFVLGIVECVALGVSTV